MDTSPFQMRSSFSGSSSLEAQGLYPIRRASEFDIGLPPRYSTLTGALPGLTDDNGVTFRPPAYSRIVQQRSQSVARCGHGGQNIFQTSTHSHARDGIHQHEYHIMNGNKGKPWATLKVYSGSSSDGLNTPHYMEGDIIRGSFELNLDPPQNISSISLSVSNENSQLSISVSSFFFFVVAVSCEATSTPAFTKTEATLFLISL